MVIFSGELPETNAAGRSLTFCFLQNKTDSGAASSTISVPRVQATPEPYSQPASPYAAFCSLLPTMNGVNASISIIIM